MKQRTVGLLAHPVLRHRRVERRPAGAGIELGVRGEQRRSAADAAIGSLRVVVPVLAGERALGAFLARDPVLLGSQLRPATRPRICRCRSIRPRRRCFDRCRSWSSSSWVDEGDVRASADVPGACAIVAAPLRILTADPSDLDTVPAASFRRDARVIGVVSLAHGLSHFLQLALPPLFPLLKVDFDVSWTPAGVRRRRILRRRAESSSSSRVSRSTAWARVRCCCRAWRCSPGARWRASLAPNAWWLIPCVAMMGVGNGVFHPPISRSSTPMSTPRRLGHAYSSHGIGGNLGYALAPIVSFGLGVELRLARGARRDGGRRPRRARRPRHAAAPADVAARRGCRTRTRSREARACSCRRRSCCASLYFVFQTMANRRRADVPACRAQRRTGRSRWSLATSAVTAYLLGGTAGIVAGGFLAVRASRHDLVAATWPAAGRDADEPGRHRRRARRMRAAAVRIRRALRSAPPGPRAT